MKIKLKPKKTFARALADAKRICLYTDFESHLFGWRQWSVPCRWYKGEIFKEIYFQVQVKVSERIGMDFDLGFDMVRGPLY